MPLSIKGNILEHRSVGKLMVAAFGYTEFSYSDIQK